MSGLGTNVAATQAVISLRSYMNPQGPTQQAVLNYETPDSFTAGASAVLALTVATSTTSSFDLATLFAAYGAPVFVSVCDITSPGIGFLITTVSGQGQVGVGANGWWSYIADGSTALPTIYVTNSSATQELVLSVGLMTQ